MSGFVNTNGGLGELIHALEQGDELTPVMHAKLLSLLKNGRDNNIKLQKVIGLSLACDPENRKQALDALYNLSLYRAIKEKKHHPGTKFAVATWLAAGITKALVDAYGVRVSIAVRAAVPEDATTEKFEAVSRAYRKLAGGYNPGIRVHPSLVSQATDRLDQDVVAKAIMDRLLKK